MWVILGASGCLGPEAASRQAGLGAEVVDGCFEVRGTVQSVTGATGSFAGRFAVGDEVIVRYEYDDPGAPVVTGQTANWRYPTASGGRLSAVSATVAGAEIGQVCEDNAYLDRFNVDWGSTNNSWTINDYDLVQRPWCVQTWNASLNGCPDGTIPDFTPDPVGPADIFVCTVRRLQMNGQTPLGNYAIHASIDAVTNCGAVDEDGDGVLDADDACPGTVADAPTDGLGTNRWADTDGDGTFDTTHPVHPPRRSYTLADTAGCSCAQIIDAQGLGEGHRRHGCSNSAMDDWIDSL